MLMLLLLLLLELLLLLLLWCGWGDTKGLAGVTKGMVVGGVIGGVGGSCGSDCLTGRCRCVKVGGLQLPSPSARKASRRAVLVRTDFVPNRSARTLLTVVGR